MMKRTLSLIVALVMILGMGAGVFAEETTPPAEAVEATTETPATETATEAPTTEKVEEDNPKIQWVKEQNWVEGYPDGTLGLDKNITRAEFTKVLIEGMGMRDEALKSMALPSKFFDMNGHWANGYVEVAVGTGIIKGYPDNTFKPNSNIKYSEIVAMLVRATNSIKTEEELTAVWPNTYIVKAAQAGILEGALIGNYNEPALRGKTFELVYNAANNADLKAFGNNSVVKAIVLQNQRVRKGLKDNEVNVEFMEVLQEADYVANLRGGKELKGKQQSFVIDEKVGDSEDLLGRVVNLTLDRDGKVIKITYDERYEIKTGRVSQLSDAKINSYTVNFEERYNKSDERVFATYLDSKDYRYINFAKEKPNFARITLSPTKNVLFIDAFDFKDIAPVKELRNKDQVYFYNDIRDGRVDNITADRRVIKYDKKYGFRNGKAEDIKEDDVIHVFNDRDMIVRKDARVEEELVRTFRDKWNDEYVQLGSGDNKIEAMYNTEKADYFRAVYSYEKKEYRTLRARADLDPIVKEKVKALLDINGDLQLIDSNIPFNGGIAAIDNIRSIGEVRFTPSQGKKYVGVETWNTRYFGPRGQALNNRLMENYDVDDLVYTDVLSDDKDVEELRYMYKLASEKETFTIGTKTYKDGYAKNFEKASVNSRYITVDGMAYKYYDKTSAFYYKDGRLHQYNIKNANKIDGSNKDLKAFVITEEEIYDLLDTARIRTYNFLGKDKYTAGAVIFAESNASTRDGKARIVQIEEVVRSNPREILVRYANNDNYKNAAGDYIRTQNFEIDADLRSKFEEFNIGDIIKITIDEESLEEKDGKDPIIVNAHLLIKDRQATREVAGPRRGDILDLIGGEPTYLDLREAKIFGDTRDRFVQYELLDNVRYNEAEAVRFVRREIEAPVPAMVEAVEKMIDAISNDAITASNNEDIERQVNVAKAAYDGLSEADKKLVRNIDKLNQRIKDIADYKGEVKPAITATATVVQDAINEKLYSFSVKLSDPDAVVEKAIVDGVDYTVIMKNPEDGSFIINYSDKQPTTISVVVKGVADPIVAEIVVK